jgi:UDP-2,3-diacylglucosamine pyrophosphatase LpxH
MSRVKYRTVWISDTHLGSRGAQAPELARFLKRIDCERLYLVGDIIDFYRLKNRSRWPKCHNDVVRRLLKLIKRGTEVIFIPGNHDEALRQYVGMNFGGIHIRMNAVHECADGRKLLVTHGDQFDLVVKHSRLLSLIGATAYEWLLLLNRQYNRFRRWRGLPYRSLSQFIKLKVKRACVYVSRFEETIIKEAGDRGMDGVVCGHIHKPEFSERDGGIQYFNCGDWIECCTALVEYQNGEMELIQSHEFLTQFEHDDLPEEETIELFEEVLDADCDIDWQLTPFAN